MTDNVLCDFVNFQRAKQKENLKSNGYKLIYEYELINKVYLKMHRKQDLVSKPSSGRGYQTSPAAFYPIEYSETQPIFNSRIQTLPKTNSIPFNQSSSINFTSNQIQHRSRFDHPLKHSSTIRLVPNSNKIYFSYINPRTLNVEKHYIQTIVHQTEKPSSNEWEQRYFELFRQMNDLLLNNEKISEEFLKLKQELKVYNENSIMHSIQNYNKSQSIQVDTVPQRQYDELARNYEIMKMKLSQIQRQARQAALFKEQNIRMKMAIEKLQNQIISEKNLIYKNQIEKSDAVLKNTHLQYEIKQLSNEKLRLQSQIYDLKMVLANKNLQIENLMMKKNEQKNKSPQKMTQQKFQQRLARIRIQYQKKQKKLQKMLESKQKQSSQLRKLLIQIEQKQKSSRELKQNYQKMYNEKKEQVTNLKKFQQSLLNSQEDERQIIFYQQRINQLNKIAREQADKIKELEKSKQDMGKKIQQYQDNYVSQEQLNYLHQVIETNKNQLLEEGGVNYDQLNNKASPYYNGKIFEKKMIYELKKDNQKLVEFLQKMKIKDLMPQNQVVFNQNIVVNHQSGANIGMAMQHMITDIFSKLDRLTQGVKISSGQNLGLNDVQNEQSPSKSKRSKESPKKSKRKQRDELKQQKVGINRVSNQLQILKVYLFDLSSTCEKLVKKLQTEHDERIIQQQQKKEAIMSEIKITSMAPKDQEMISFYKQKNQELEGRITELLNLSNMLKQKLCEKYVQQNSGEEYWKNQVKSVRDELQELRQRYEKLLANFQRSQDKKQDYQSKCALYILQIERLTKSNNTKQQKLHCLQQKQKQLTQLQSLKQKYQRELSIQVHKSQQMSIKIEEYIKLLNIKQIQINQINNKYQQLVKNKQIVEVSNIERYNKVELLEKSVYGLEGLVSQWKKKYQDQFKNVHRLENQIRDLKKQVQGQKSMNSQLQRQINDMRSRLDQRSNQSQVQLQNQRKRTTSLQQQISQFRLRMEEQTRRYSVLDKSYVQLKTKYDAELVNSSLLKYKLEQQIRISQAKTSNTGGTVGGVDPFMIEKLRSLVIETQTLYRQLSMQVAGRNKQINGNIGSNFNTILNIISQIGSSSSSNTSNSAKQQQLLKKIENLERKINQCKQINSYKLEMLRSLLIQFQCLLKQIKISQVREKDIVKTIQTHLNQGLDHIATFYLF